MFTTAAPAAAGSTQPSPPGLGAAATLPYPFSGPQAQVQRFYCPALGFAHLTPEQAQAALLEKITGVCVLHSGGGGKQPAVSRTCVFPGSTRRYEVMVKGRSRAAQMTSETLGATLVAQLNGELTSDKLAHFLGWLLDPLSPE